MSKQFIPELHDIGKLVDDEVKEDIELLDEEGRKKHTFENFNFEDYGFTKPTSPSWWGQYHHTIGRNENINDWEIPKSYRYYLFILILADHLASSISRATPEIKTDKKYIYVKLWNKNFYENQVRSGEYWAVFKTVDSLKNVFDEINNCNSGKEFLNKYREYLLLTPEDKNVPRNITSLYTHVELVGKIYQVLMKNTRCNIESNGSIAIEYDEEKAKTINDAENNWEWRLVKCWINFPHSFVRLRDINLLKKRNELINYLKNKFEDEVLFATSDFVMLFLPLNQDLKEIFKPFLDYGLYIEVNEIVSKLELLESALDKRILEERKLDIDNINAKIYKKYLLPDIPDEINPPICDICQQRKGINQEKENIKEWICEKCQKIREMGEPFDRYATQWGKEGVGVCWFKFSIDQTKLENWLTKSFEKYVSEMLGCGKTIYELNKEIYYVTKLKKEMENRKKKLEKDVKKIKDTNEKRKKIGTEIGKLSKEIKTKERELNVLKKNFDRLDKYVSLFRPLAPQIDFNKDYERMLNDFWKICKNRDDIEKPISDYNELGVFKYSPELIKEVIEAYLEVFNKYFPDVKGDENCPISLSLSIGNIKYPIREHWRFFEKEEKSFLNVRKHNAFIEGYAKYEVCRILKVINNIESKSFLYKLVQLDNLLNSETYLAVEVFNNRKKYPEVYNLFSEKIKPTKILNLHRVLGGEGNE